MAVLEGNAAARVRLARQLAEIGDSFRDAARRRRVARDHGDVVAETQAQTAIEAAFRAREHVVAELARAGGAPTNAPGGPVGGVRQSRA